MESTGPVTRESGSWWLNRKLWTPVSLSESMPNALVNCDLWLLQRPYTHQMDNISHCCFQVYFHTRLPFCNSLDSRIQLPWWWWWWFGVVPLHFVPNKLTVTHSHDFQHVFAYYYTDANTFSARTILVLAFVFILPIIMKMIFNYAHPPTLVFFLQANEQGISTTLLILELLASFSLGFQLVDNAHRNGVEAFM